MIDTLDRPLDQPFDRPTIETPLTDAERREAKALDGTWPVCRPDMTARAPIIARMAEDCDKTFAAHGLVDEESLVRRGWPRETVRRYAEPARIAFVRAIAARTKAARIGTGLAA